MNKPSKKLGVIVGVDGDISQMGTYSLSNDSSFLWYGEFLSGPKVGAFLTINQNDIKIIASVSSEKIIDQQNNVRSIEFDNRYRKDSINRIITLKTKGVIENNQFQVSSKFVPMIGNEVTITSTEELEIIYDFDKNDESIHIGKSLLEDRNINLPINKFFASHIGIFGNTGSGKSNTLHKLYLQLFRTKFFEAISSGVSQFFVIDFNGEYTAQNSFGVSHDEKEIFTIVTSKEQRKKLPIKRDYLFDPDILAILFDARAATQVPFLRKAINLWNDMDFNNVEFGAFVMGTLKNILSTGDSANSESKDSWIKVAKQYVTDEKIFNNLESLEFNSTHKSYFIDGIYINDKSVISDNAIRILNLKAITDQITQKYNSSGEMDRLQMHLQFQKIHQTAWKSTNIEHLNPLFNRIETAFTSLKKVIEVVDDISNCYKTLNIISLVHSNQEIKRLIPMLISKMIYDEQKKDVSGEKVCRTKHLIIDEAHNILNADFRNVGDGWQDYRMSVFEEIVKEGRKFGFYLTLSSQRPADISPTILSQIHNYFIHRLVNEKDLRMLENTMPTLDKNSYQMLPSLGQGEAIVSGNAIQIPILVKVEKEKTNRPNSDDIKLTDIWEVASLFM